MVPTPEHDKLALVKDKCQAIGDFLTWTRATLCLPHHHDKAEDGCYEHGLRRAPTCGLSEGEMLPIRISIEKHLADYFDIDLSTLEDEKRAMLDELRAENQRADSRAAAQRQRRKLR